MNPRLTRPCWMSSLKTNCAVLLATAKQMPCAPMMTAVLMPITSPREDTSGPPELPGFKAASVWITSSINRPLRARKERPSAEMTPAVTVDSKPSGLPIATTSWPRLSALESPKRACARSRAEPAQQRQIGIGVLAEAPRLHDAAFGVEQAHVLGAVHHVAVGQHQPVRRDDDAGAEPAGASIGAARFHAHHRRADSVGHRDYGIGIGVEESAVGRRRRGVALLDIGRRCKIEHKTLWVMLAWP